LILADPAGGRGQPCPGIVNDTALDVLGLMTRFCGECSAYPLLLDILPELHKLPCFLVEPGLHLADLLELCVLTPPQGLGLLGLCFVAEGLLGRSDLRLKLFV
jgi:hypothetical protein